MMRQRNMLDNRKSQTNTIAGMIILIIATIESLENTALLANDNASATIKHADYRLRALLIGFGHNIDRRTVL